MHGSQRREFCSGFRDERRYIILIFPESRGPRDPSGERQGRMEPPIRVRPLQLRCTLFLVVIAATIIGTALSLSLYLSTLLMESVFTFSRNAPIKLTASTPPLRARTVRPPTNLKNATGERPLAAAAA